MPTPTINYDFNLPTVGADDDVWGDLLNDNWTDLDAQLFNGTIGADTTGNAATATTATLATSATALATARTVTIGATGKAFDGSADVSWDLAEIGLLFADQAEAEAGTDNTKLMTPLRVAQAAALVSVPVGSVFYVASSAAPSGYLKANGATISRITYAALFAAIGTTFGAGDGSTTFVLPDLRGEFVRGWDDARGVDSGRAFGSSQDDELKSHNHSILYGRSNNTSSATLGSAVGLDGSSQLSENTGGTETRPRNVALLAVIKF